MMSTIETNDPDICLGCEVSVGTFNPKRSDMTFL